MRKLCLVLLVILLTVHISGCSINSTSGETVNFMRFGSDEFMDKYLTRILFEGIDSVSVSDSGVYVNVYDIEYDISGL